MTQGVGQDVVIETRGNGALCGVRFDVGQSYILMGKPTLSNLIVN